MVMMSNPHLTLSPLFQLSQRSLRPSSSSSFCAFFFLSRVPFSLCPLLYLHLTLSPDLSFSPLLTLSPLLRHSCLPSFLSSSPSICNVSPNISMLPHLGAPVNTLFSTIHLFLLSYGPLSILLSDLSCRTIFYSFP